MYIYTTVGIYSMEVEHPLGILYLCEQTKTSHINITAEYILTLNI